MEGRYSYLLLNLSNDIGRDPWNPAYPLSLSVGDQWQPIANAFVGNVGAFQFALIPTTGSSSPGRMPQDGLVLEASIEHGHTVLSTHSSVGYFNCTSLRLCIVQFEGDLQRHTIDLDSRQSCWASLSSCALDAFSIGVVEGGDVVRQLGRLSLSALRRKRRTEHVFRVSGRRHIFLCAASGGAWPGRLTITLRAPLDVCNRLPYPIDVRFNEEAVTHVQDGDDTQIETNVDTDVQMQFALVGFEWSEAINIFADRSQLGDGRRRSVTIRVQDALGANLYVVVDISRVVADYDDGGRLNGRALFEITIYVRLWLLNKVPDLQLIFGTSKGAILPGQDWGRV